MSLYQQFRPYFHFPPTERLQILRTEALRLSASVLALASRLDQYYANLPENEQHAEIRRVIGISLTGAKRIHVLFTSESIRFQNVSLDDLQAIRHDLIMPMTSISGSAHVLKVIAHKEPMQVSEAQQALIDRLRQTGTDLRDVLDALADPHERQ
jgi:K+-sensing histidine kinase KdpD